MSRAASFQTALSAFHNYGPMPMPAKLSPCTPRRSRSQMQIRALNTFLPYPSLERSIQCLDKRRLGKQRVEAMQILNVISDDPPPVNGDLLAKPPPKELVKPLVHELLVVASTAPKSVDGAKGKRRGWVNAPVVRMWRGYSDALACYYNICLAEWERRGCRNILLQPIELPADSAPIMPPWFGDDAIHASHRSNLLRKEPEHYGQFGWTEPDSLPYIWPVPLVKVPPEEM
ncbi:hypothetical protein MPTK1_2g12340 [Marchantia polymorpha subsp. ruderalis]|uniref:Uncharacterized protein n=2 Tax=Marchantia polymorpha TaxID=3197 RepID=A0A176W6J3_MARPO|nr:hypothetical protein AXG93_312s1060 [Marchantia polymorpha subsp. ruderalis]PTQ43274.1 hypothetical protein MARPO_0026s0137 [Marchantia polymorpha]BBN02047.1 hypothetical protein Mp_2g12340 [Marchantia polymorpha subsp. ruderalis]|eukprot:PTQ43274.1 hypothetical protein MARPO_0026s0137 [Marchantia polymorpha]